jgi:hypothetical protein
VGVRARLGRELEAPLWRNAPTRSARQSAGRASSWRTSSHCRRRSPPVGQVRGPAAKVRKPGPGANVRRLGGPNDGPGWLDFLRPVRGAPQGRPDLGGRVDQHMADGYGDRGTANSDKRIPSMNARSTGTPSKCARASGRVRRAVIGGPAGGLPRRSPVSLSAGPAESAVGVHVTFRSGRSSGSARLRGMAAPRGRGRVRRRDPDREGQGHPPVDPDVRVSLRIRRALVTTRPDLLACELRAC